jgi:hypothetical protein
MMRRADHHQVRQISNLGGCFYSGAIDWVDASALDLMRVATGHPD